MLKFVLRLVGAMFLSSSIQAQTTDEKTPIDMKVSPI